MRDALSGYMRLEGGAAAGGGADGEEESGTVRTLSGTEAPSVTPCDGLDDGAGARAHGRSSVLGQPPNMSSALTLKPYQLLGLNWLHSLHALKLNGILADESARTRGLAARAAGRHARLGGTGAFAARAAWRHGRGGAGSRRGGAGREPRCPRGREVARGGEGGRGGARREPLLCRPKAARAARARSADARARARAPPPAAAACARAASQWGWARRCR